MATRAKQNNFDHDLLIRIDEKLNQFITRFDEHIKENDHAFIATGDRLNALSQRLQSLEKDFIKPEKITGIENKIDGVEEVLQKKIEELQKIVYIGMGLGIAIQIAITVWSHLVK